MFDLIGADVPHDQLVTILVALASNLTINLCKGLKLEANWLKVNALLSLVIGAGVAAIANGDSLERVLAGAATLVLSAGSAAVVHRGGDAVSAGVAHVRTVAEVAAEEAVTIRSNRIAVNGSEESEECPAP